MATKALDAPLTRRYSLTTRRFLITMVARRALHLVNGTASGLLVRPIVVMAARALGPGPTRLRLVKLAHNLSTPDVTVEPPELALVEEPATSVQPSQRAA
jgi:hypothetical protein